MSSTFGPLSTTRYTVNGVTFDMVRVPPGRFIDGSVVREDLRELMVSRPFEIGMTLVTQSLWAAVTGAWPAHARDGQRPVDQVTRTDIDAFLRELEGLGFTGFDLPTAAEWSWAARCGVATAWAGANRTASIAALKRHTSGWVAARKASAAGLFDMTGNMSEYTSDIRLETQPAGVDVRVDSPAERRRVAIGGSWADGPEDALLSRPTSAGNEPYDDIGLRLVRRQP